MTLHAAELTAKINFEMTETSKQVLRNAIIEILSEPYAEEDSGWVNELARAIEQRIVSRLRYGRDPKIEVK